MAPTSVTAGSVPSSLDPLLEIADVNLSIEAALHRPHCIFFDDTEETQFQHSSLPYMHISAAVTMWTF